jgi:MFS family permease
MSDANPYQSPIETPDYLRSTAPETSWYAWLMVIVAAAAMVATLPGRTQGLGLITEPLLADLQLSRVQYASLNLWATLLGAVFCLPCGWLIDRFGSRAVLSLVLLALAGVVLGMARAESFAVMFVYVLLTRGLGQSMLSVVSITLVGKWLTRRLALAMGLYSLVVGLAFSFAFVGVGSLVLNYQWRAAWSMIGVALLIFAAIAAIVVRDGQASTSDATKQRVSSEAASATLTQALVSPSFWVFALATSLYGMISSGISLFNQSILAERGFPAEVFHQVLGLSAFTGMAANLLGGWLASRWSLGGVLCLAMVGFSSALLALPLVQTLWHVYAYAVTIGAAGGVVTVVFFSIWGHAFGSAHLGKIQGIAQMLTVLASAVGPLLFAECHARTGSYSLVFYVVAPLALTIGLAAWLVPLPSAAGGSWTVPSAEETFDDEIEGALSRG